jgi:TonB family protein
MYFDFYDNHPDTPRVPPALTPLERGLLVLVAYLLVVIAYLVTPRTFWQIKPAPALAVPEQPLRFVQIEPLRDTPATPKRPDPSDMDRRSTTVVKPPTPKNQDPVSRGNSPEKFVAAPPEDRSAAAAPQPTSPPILDDGAGKSPNGPPIDPQPARGLGSGVLHSLQRYLPQTYDNPDGGQTDQGADIQFDSKGVDFGPWLRRFRLQIYRNWLIPNAAEFQVGELVIQLDIHKNGAITNLRIVRSSGHEALDVAAYNALKLSNPTLPLPAGFPDEVAPFTVTFRYLR